MMNNKRNPWKIISIILSLLMVSTCAYLLKNGAYFYITLIVVFTIINISISVWYCIYSIKTINKPVSDIASQSPSYVSLLLISFFAGISFLFIAISKLSTTPHLSILQSIAFLIIGALFLYRFICLVISGKQYIERKQRNVYLIKTYPENFGFYKKALVIYTLILIGGSSIYEFIQKTAPQYSYGTGIFFCIITLVYITYSLHQFKAAIHASEAKDISS